MVGLEPACPMFVLLVEQARTLLPLGSLHVHPALLEPTTVELGLACPMFVLLVGQARTRWQ